jgi:ABC-type microcin C transport system permease subunit YejB
MGTGTSLCTLFLQVMKKKQTCISVSQITYSRIEYSEVTYQNYSIFCLTKYTLIKSYSLSIYITTTTHLVQITVNISHKIMNNSARITSKTHCLSLHPLFIYALTIVKSINVRNGLFFLHKYFSFMVHRENILISLWKRKHMIVKFGAVAITRSKS